MASRYRSLSRPTVNLLRSTFAQKPTPTPTPNSIPSLRPSLSSPTFPRSLSPLGSLQSLLPLYSAVSSARLTSCLGIDSTSSRSLSKGTNDYGYCPCDLLMPEKCGLAIMPSRAWS